MSEHQLSQHIDVRLGDGLTVIQDGDAITSITVCGMGGPLIAKIISDGANKLFNKPRLVLQSNIQSSAIRIKLTELNYCIIAEEIMEEKGHIYEIIVAEYCEKIIHVSNRIEIWPELVKDKNDLFNKKWQREKELKIKII